MSFAAVDFGILLPAFAAGLLVLATHVPLGGEVLRPSILAGGALIMAAALMASRDQA